MPIDLLICSDTHETAPGIGATPQSVGWLHAGDFYWNRDVATADDQADADYADTMGQLEGSDAYQWFRLAALPIYTVRGNHDGDDAWGFFRMANDVTGKVVRLAPQLLLAGVGWYGRHYTDLPSNGDFTQACMAVGHAARRLKTSEDCLILLSHYPAYPPPADRDSQEAFSPLRELAAEIGPTVIVQGHVHHWAGSQYEVSTGGRQVRVINPGPAGGVLSVDVAAKSAAFRA